MRQESRSADDYTGLVTLDLHKTVRRAVIVVDGRSSVAAAILKATGQRLLTSYANTPALYQCVKALERIQFKLAVIAYRCIHGTAPTYLADELLQPARISGSEPGYDRC